LHYLRQFIVYPLSTGIFITRKFTCRNFTCWSIVTSQKDIAGLKIIQNSKVTILFRETFQHSHAPTPFFWAVNDGEYITFLKLEGWKTETTHQNVKLPMKDAT
jgi:hypothetical protein